MSRILRRPMFRGGGKVSSYGNGIASGLGYAGGGRVNLNIGGSPFGAPIIKVPQATPPVTGGNILSRNLNKLKNLGTGNIESRIGSGIKSLYNLLPEEGLLSKTGRFATSQFPKLTKGLGSLAAVSGPGMIAEANRPKTYAALQYMKDMNQSGAFDETAIPTMDGELGEYDKFTLEFDKLNDPSKYTAIPDDRGFFNKYLNPMGAIAGLGDKSKKEIGLIVDKDNKKIKEKDPALEAAEDDPNKEIVVNGEGEPILTKKERLEKAAKEYEDILGAGIKKDSIFDAMVEGGTRLLAGEGYAAALNAANKELDPIQNIKTAARKLALEEDIAIRKAMAVSKGKETETSRKIAAMKAGDFTPQQIANALAGIKTKSISEEAKDANYSKEEGYRNWHIKNMPEVKATNFTQVKDIEKAAENLPDGDYYVTFPGDTYVRIKGKKVIAKKRRGG